MSAVGAGAQLAVTELVLLAQGPRPGQAGPERAPDSGGNGAEFGKAAPIGLVIVLLLLVALILLIRSMNRHVRGMPATFDEADQPSSPVARSFTDDA